MSGLEAVGIVTSILQIAQYAISITYKISEIYGTVSDSPAKLQEGLEQLKRLVLTVKLVAASEPLHSEDVREHVVAILERVRKLHSAVGSMATEPPKSLKRYWKVAIGNTTEKRIFDSFAQLETDKTALSLSLAANQMSLTGSVRKDVSRLVEELPSIQAIHRDIKRVSNSTYSVDALFIELEGCLPRNPITAHRADTFSTLVGNESEDNLDKYRNQGDFRTHILIPGQSEQISSGFFDNRSPVIARDSGRPEVGDEAWGKKELQSSRRMERTDMKSEGSFLTKSSTWDGSKATARFKRRLQSQDSFPLQQTPDIYRNITAVDNAKQVNGNLGDIGAKIEKPRYYEGLVAQSSSLQINGNVYSNNFETTLSSNQ